MSTAYFKDLQKIRDDYTIILNNKMNEIANDFITKIDIKIGDMFIPFEYEKGNASFVIKKDFKHDAKVIFANGEDKISVMFVGDTICSSGTIYYDEDVYCDFSINELGDWFINDNRFSHIEPTSINKE